MTHSLAKSAYFVLATTLAVSAPARSEAACTHDDFYAFLMEFQNDPAEQLHNSAARIAITTRPQTGSATAEMITEAKAKEDLDWPIMPTLDQLGQRDFRYRIYQLDPLEAELTAVDAEGIDGFLTWYFERKPCWQLVGYTDAVLRP